MAKLDPKFTQELKTWYMSDHSSDDMIRKGAELLLRLNRNRVLYQQIVRTPKRLVKKLEYEIKKHIDIRQDGYTLDDVKKLAESVLPHISAAADEELSGDNLPIINGQEGVLYPKVTSIGKRPDHDSLPPEIQKLWTDNAERWKKIKATFELCKELTQPCDLYEHVKLLKEAWYRYKKDMVIYDEYKNSKGKAATSNSSGVDQQAVNYAQSYVSRYLPNLLELAKEAKEPGFTDKQKSKLEDLRIKIQNRVDILLKAGVSLSEQRISELRSVDISIPEDAKGKGSE